MEKETILSPATLPANIKMQDQKPLTTQIDDSMANTKNKVKKAKKRKVLKYYNVDRLGDLKVCEYFFWRGIWKRELLAYRADFLFHIFEDNIDWPNVNDKMVNKVPGITFLSHKQQHAYVFRQFKRFHDNEMPELGFPETFLLPYERKKYEEVHSKNKKTVYLTKQDTGSQGTGIVLLMKPSQLVYSGEDLVVQRYIHNPYLIRGLKHDMRVYVTVTSVEPLRVYINNDGLVRFCTEEYEEPNNQNRIKGTMHLSNYSLNKNSAAYVFSDSLEETSDGSKQLLSVYLSKYPNAEEFWAKLISMVMHSMVALRPFLRYYLRCAYPKQDQGKMFHIIGYDVIIDSDGELHLLELNSNPSLNVQFEGSDEMKDQIKSSIRPNKAAAEDESANAQVKTASNDVDSRTKQKNAGSKDQIKDRKLAFGSSLSVSRKPTEPKVADRSMSRTKKQTKPKVPKLTPQPSIIEEIEEEDTPMKDLLAKYKKFRDYEFERNEARKRPADIDPICFVDLHIKSK